MIGRIQGEVVDKSQQHILVDVGGVGYEVQVSEIVAEGLTLGSEVILFTYDHIRENMRELFGFIEPQQKALFELMIGVSGIGPKAALAISNLGSNEQIRKAIAGGNIVFISKASGVGKRTAERLCIELKDKVGVMAGEVVDLSDVNEADDAYQALQSLGYSSSQATRALANIDSELPTAERIKLALKEIK